MTEKIPWQMYAKAGDGEKFNLAGELEVDIYDRSHKNLADGSEVPVELLPDAGGDVKFLMVKTSDDSYKDGLTYGINADGSETSKLDGPIFLVGKSVVELFLPSSPLKKFTFKNATGAEVEIDILIGRDAS